MVGRVIVRVSLLWVMGILAALLLIGPVWTAILMWLLPEMRRYGR